MSNFETGDWYPNYDVESWTEVPEQSALRTQWAVECLEYGFEGPVGSTPLASFRKIVKNEDGSLSRTKESYYGIPKSIDTTDPDQPTALFSTLTESIYDDTFVTDKDGRIINYIVHSEEILRVRQLVRIALAETVDLVCSNDGRATA